MDEAFWQSLDRLVAGTRVVLDRPGGSAHPRFPDFIYPYDYGYLEGTRAMDGGGIDVWRGSRAEARITGVVLTSDSVKRDVEIKLLLGCSPEEMQVILAVHQRGGQAGILLTR